jgi:hypothetical protein
MKPTLRQGAGSLPICATGLREIGGDAAYYFESF